MNKPLWTNFCEFFVSTASNQPYLQQKLRSQPTDLFRTAALAYTQPVHVSILCYSLWPFYFNLSRSHTLASLAATPQRIEQHFSVFCVSAQSQRSLSAFAMESQCIRSGFNLHKIFRFVAQSPCSRIAVSVGLQWIRHQIGGDGAETALQTYGDCSETGECTETAWRII